jgi:hypothetical protein
MTERTLDHVQTDYNTACAEAGQTQYEILDLGEKLNRFNRLITILKQEAQKLKETTHGNETHRNGSSGVHNQRLQESQNQPTANESV